MPPKKKANKVVEESIPSEPSKTAEKPQPVTTELKKEEVKPSAPTPSAIPSLQTPVAESSSNIQPAPVSTIQPSAKTNPKDPQPNKQIQPAEISTQPHSNLSENVEAMTEQERIKSRQLRFGNSGTTEEAEDLKNQRMKKFGLGSQAEQKEIVEARKSKFGGGSAMVEENEQMKKQRREKFGAPGVTDSIDKEKIEERNKKFGKKQDQVNLDAEIKKSKGIRKDGNGHHKNRFSKKNYQQGRR